MKCVSLVIYWTSAINFYDFERRIFLDVNIYT